MANSDVCPENLRFTQDSIKNTFKKPYEYQRIDDAVDQIRNNQLSPAVLMPLTVVHHKSVLWSLDNRRLWVLRKAGVPTVKLILVPHSYNRRSNEFFSSLNDPLVRRYSSANYFPRVRGGVRSVGINRGKGFNDGVPRPPIRIPHYPTVVAGTNKTPGIPPARIPHHLKTGTVRVDIPAKVNYEANSMGFDKESQPMVDCNVCPNNLRFTQHSNVSTSGGAPPPPIPLLLHHPTNSTLPKSISTAPSPSPPPHHLRDITVRINIPPPPNGGAPPLPVPLLHHHSTTLANITFPKYTPTPPPTLHHVRVSTARLNIHPSVPPLPNTSGQLSEVTVPLLSNNSSGPSEKKGSCLWDKILNFLCWVKNKVFGCFGPTTRAGNQGN
ncbi:hypothetical protein SUGI_0101930 [Cryptomeria japonica]|nr:hypothetical protein SUGI_0101930 [Cryptomeria japonica]